MAVRRFASCFLALIFVALSGCSSQAPPAADPSLPTITDPRDFSSPNATAPGYHIHDYWQGRTNLTVLDEEHGPMSASCSGCTEGMTIGWFLPPDGIIVPQGTAWVNVTVSIDSDSGDLPYELWVQKASDNEPVRAGTIRDGEPLKVLSSKEANDPPHYVLSLWQFQVVIAKPDAEFTGSLRMNVRAYRGLPLEPYPPHPDHWQGKTELVVATDATGPGLSYQTRDGQRTSTTCYFGCLGGFGPQEDAVVPFDADHVDIALTYDVGAVPGFRLRYHGADTREMREAPVQSEAPGRTVYRIEVQKGEGDSPYAPRSLWQFSVEFQESPASVWAGSYKAEVVAVKAA